MIGGEIMKVASFVLSIATLCLSIAAFVTALVNLVKSR